MTKTINPTQPYIFLPELDPEGDTDWWNAWPRPAKHVTKIVLGKLDESQTGLQLPNDLAERFPELKLLHLWGLEDLKELPALPNSLKELDVRGCKNLQALPELPPRLEVLVVGGAPELKTFHVGSCGPELVDLAVNDCPKLEECALHQIIDAAPKLKELDLSGCVGLTQIYNWPPLLERIELNRCSALQAVPFEDEDENDSSGRSWPSKLRRLGMRGASAIEWLPRLPDYCDYLDFAYMSRLEALPLPWGNPRTLFLYGSGVQAPPAPEHGEDDEENVAEKTAEFFEDIRLVGRGRVKRCRLLVLGNGGAGKTCLSLNLTGRDPKKAEELGSTHGVQFWSWRLPVKLKGMTEADMQMWDFGGQEIYHSTHRLFVSRGALFIVVWNPDETKYPVAKPTNEGYQDEWRPLQYWFDYITRECTPVQPRIALVCSRREEKTEELEKRWREQLSAEHQKRVEKCFYINSRDQIGDNDALKTWVKNNASDLIRAEGTAVPIHWDIAQSMVQDWLTEPKPQTQLSVGDFQAALSERLRTQIEEAPRRYHLLEKTLQELGELFLNERRMERTLSFLTRIGWIFWKEDLFESRVIVGQKWALNGIYTLLDRRKKVRNTDGDLMNNEIYSMLEFNCGRFTRKDLNEWSKRENGKRESISWNDYSKEEQQLFLSFMEEINLCFQVIPVERGHWRYLQEPLYISIEHLPDDNEEIRGQVATGVRAWPADRKMPSPWLHKGDWHALLKTLGQEFGKEGKYAKKVVGGVNTNDQRIMVCYEPEKDQFGLAKGFGGQICVSVNGPDAQQRCDEVARLVAECIPNLKDGVPDETSERILDRPHQGTGKRDTTVFVSYAWNPSQEYKDFFHEGYVPPDYERPVHMLEEALKKYDGIHIIRDQNEVKQGDDIIKFIHKIKEADYIIVVHSDKYWKSPYCLYEFHEAVESVLNRADNVANHVKQLSHPSSRVYDAKRNACDEYNTFWKTQNDCDGPPRLKSIGVDMAKLKLYAEYIFKERLPRLHCIHKNYIRWPDKEDDQQKVIEDLAQQIATPPPLPTGHL